MIIGLLLKIFPIPAILAKLTISFKRFFVRMLERSGSRISVLQGRINWGGALSGRDIEAVNKTVSGLVKLLFPDPKMAVPDEELETIVKIALEARAAGRF